ncbi:MAG: molybdenum cofactor biosynthesis protein B [Bryobacter sp.]|nr:molybdenum cofactor biosynthesis protein B [Bryobacter sp.]
MSTEQHRQMAAEQAQAQGSIGVCLITVSDTRTPATDANGKYLRAELETMGHRIALYRIIKDEPAQVEAVLEEAASTDCRLILFNGGTGIAPRDTTFDVLSRKLEKVLPGFGELFRMISFQDHVGPAAMLSRATAGTFRGKVVFSTPGSTNAVEVAWKRLIQPELAHLAWEVGRSK